MKIIPTIIYALFSLSLFSEAKKLKVGEQYDIATRTELREQASAKSKKKVNKKASDILKEIIYLSVDSSATVKAVSIKGDWVEIQVVQPKHLINSHKGWIPKSSIKLGGSTNKRSGWIRHTCEVFSKPSDKSKQVGFIAQPASVGVSDNGSGWLKLIHAPVKNLKTKKYVDFDASKPLYIKSENFTETIPAKWKSK